MSLKLYVAGASAEIDEIEPRMKRLREVGAEVVGDWCRRHQGRRHGQRGPHRRTAMGVRGKGLSGRPASQDLLASRTPRAIHRMLGRARRGLHARHSDHCPAMPDRWRSVLRKAAWLESDGARLRWYLEPRTTQGPPRRRHD